MINIRPAEYRDLMEIITQGEAFYRYAGLDKYGLRFDQARFLRTLLEMMANKDAIMLVAEVDGVFAGTIAGIMAPWFLDTTQLTAGESWWWVLPEFRGSDAGKRLLEAFETEAKERGASLIAMVAFENERIKALDRIYGRRGYSRAEYHYFRRIDNGSQPN
jgi:GNAT superfamily N-acetyltransferase